MRTGHSKVAVAAVFVVALGASRTAGAQILTDEPRPAPPAAPAPAPMVAPPPAAAAPAQPQVAPPPAQPAPQPGVTTPAAPPAPGAAVAAHAEAPRTGEDAVNDHDRFVGHVGVGYFGVTQLPIGSENGAAVINTPVIGARYWMKRELGLDFGLGFALASGSREADGTSTDKPSQLGFAVHGGVPYNLYIGKHYNFQVVPELTLGITSATIKGTPDVSLSGLRLDLGARMGGEVHFGFMGLPELALQASIGVYLRRESYSATPSGGSSSGEGTTTVATSVQNDPWALFSNNISALYYF